MYPKDKDLKKKTNFLTPRLLITLKRILIKLKIVKVKFYDLYYFSYFC